MAAIVAKLSHTKRAKAGRCQRCGLGDWMLHIWTVPPRLAGVNSPMAPNEVQNLAIQALRRLTRDRPRANFVL